jgi:hypothetical protein
MVTINNYKYKTNIQLHNTDGYNDENDENVDAAPPWTTHAS